MYRSLLTTCPVNTSSVMIRRSHLDRAGRFDESLRCWEDYDMWLRLALQGPFRFLPGPAVIYQVAASGRFLSSVLTGESERDLRPIVQAGLERLRSKEAVSEEFRMHVDASVVTRLSGQTVRAAGRSGSDEPLRAKCDACWPKTSSNATTDEPIIQPKSPAASN